MDFLNFIINIALCTVTCLMIMYTLTVYHIRIYSLLYYVLNSI